MGFAVAAILGCAARSSPPTLPAELAPFASHLKFESRESLPTGTFGVRNNGEIYRVDMPFDEAVKTLAPIMAKAGLKPTPEIDVKGMRSVGFIKSSSESYAVEDLGHEPPGTCVLGHSVMK